GEIEFIPFDERNPDVGTLQVDMNASFFINDGQHRRAGIIEAMKQNPELARESISVVIYPDEGQERANQMFADLNRYAQKSTKSLNVLYDARDPLSQATSEMMKRIEIFGFFTDKDRVSLASKSPKLFTLGSLYEANKYLLKINRKKLREFSEEDKETIIAYWTEVVKNMPIWAMARHGEMKTWEVREEYICSHSVIIQALGLVGSYLLERSDWQMDLSALQEVDWRRSNPEWKGVVISANGRVVNSKPVVKLSAILIRQKMGLGISSAEQKELDSVR
ncbi:MAG: DNA sulfur modification protein DndB, partial [Syntrophomonas sp.]|nr:DNA sulfur modification protein DndB [Syntrophomonas sp.]